MKSRSAAMALLAAAATVIILLPSAAAYADNVCRPAADVADRYAPINVQFDSGSTMIKPDDKKRIADMAKIAKASKIQQICVKGFADKQGDAAMNERLSRARAEAVAVEFARNGVGRDMIAIAGGGEPAGELFASRQVKSVADRRAEIRIAR